MKLAISVQVFEKSSNIKFHENLSSGSRVLPCGQTDRQTDGRQTDMMNLIVTFFNGSAPNKCCLFLKMYTKPKFTVWLKVESFNNILY